MFHPRQAHPVPLDPEGPDVGMHVLSVESLLRAFGRLRRINTGEVNESHIPASSIHVVLVTLVLAPEK